MLNVFFQKFNFDRPAILECRGYLQDSAVILSRRAGLH
jgi:hypothetical protein